MYFSKVTFIYCTYVSKSLFPFGDSSLFVCSLSLGGKLWPAISITWGTWWRIRYSDWLRSGRFGDGISVGGEIFRTCPDRPWGPPSLLYNGYRVFPGGKERPGRDADPSPRSSAVVMKEQSYTSTPPMGRTACTEPQCLYKGTLYITFYILDLVLQRT